MKYSDSETTMMDFKGGQFEWDIILWGVRWYVAYPISYRQLEEMMQARSIEVDHSSLNCWVPKYTPALDHVFRQRKLGVWTRCKSASRASGTICIEPSTKRDTLLTSFSLPGGTASNCGLIPQNHRPVRYAGEDQDR
jgi:hypothetical protein